MIFAFLFTICLSEYSIEFNVLKYKPNNSNLKVLVNYELALKTIVMKTYFPAFISSEWSSCFQTSIFRRDFESNFS